MLSDAWRKKKVAAVICFPSYGRELMHRFTLLSILAKRELSKMSVESVGGERGGG